MIPNNRLLLSLFFLVLGFVVYTPSLNNDFVWDDVLLIRKSSIYFQKSPRLSKILIPKNKRKRHGYYRPLLHLSMFADYKLWGKNPFGFHLTNVLLFAIICSLFFIFASETLCKLGYKDSKPIAILASFFFVLHPMHVESVSWVSGRTDLLCTLFLLAAFTFHSQFEKKSHSLFIAPIFFYLALLSKETALAFPLITLCFDLISKRDKKRSFVINLSYIAIAFFYLWARSKVIHNTEENLFVNTTSIQQKPLMISILREYITLVTTLSSSYLSHITKLVFPIQFNAYIPSLPEENTYKIISLIFVFLISIIFINSLLKKRKVIAFSIFWTMSTLGPATLLSIFPVSATPVAERYLFTPSAGFCLLLGFTYHFYKSNRSKYTRRLLLLCLVLVLTLFAFLTVERQKIWKNRLSFWKETTKVNPHKAFPRTNYAKTLHDFGEYKKAIEQYLIALSPKTDDTNIGRAITANNLALVYLEIGDYSRATLWLERAKSFSPTYYKTYYHLGLLKYIEAETKRENLQSLKEAEKLLKKSLELKPDYGRANLLLAKTYLALGEKEEAIEYARKARKKLFNNMLRQEAQSIIEMSNDSGNHNP